MLASSNGSDAWFSARRQGFDPPSRAPSRSRGLAATTLRFHRRNAGSTPAETILLTTLRDTIYSAHHRTVRCRLSDQEPAFHVQRDNPSGMCALHADNGSGMVGIHRVIESRLWIGYDEAPVQRSRHRCNPAGVSRVVVQLTADCPLGTPAPQAGVLRFSASFTNPDRSTYRCRLTPAAADGPLAQRKSTAFATRGSAVRARRGPPFCRRSAPRSEASNPRSSRTGIGSPGSLAGSCFTAWTTRHLGSSFNGRTALWHSVNRGSHPRDSTTSLRVRWRQIQSGLISQAGGCNSLTRYHPGLSSNGRRARGPPKADEPPRGGGESSAGEGYARAGPRTRKKPVRIRPGPPAGRASHVGGTEHAGRM
jgi:hypothetical protein